MLKLSLAVQKKLGLYVYRLVDPRNGETFYVGKGGENERVFDHVKSALSENDELVESEKNDRIQAIEKAGLEVIHIIHRHNIPSEAIYEVEGALIDAYPGLTNIQNGHGNNDYGVMNISEVIQKYNLPEMPEPQHNVVLININSYEGSIYDTDSLLRQTQKAWRMSKAKAEKSDYVLSVRRGVVIGAFKPKRWVQAMKSNFPGLEFDIPNRIGFFGEKASEDVWTLYVGSNGKQINNNSLKHSQNPIRYSY